MSCIVSFLPSCFEFWSERACLTLWRARVDGLRIGSIDDATQVVDVFKCPLQDSCSKLSFAAVLDPEDGTTRNCTAPYTFSPEVPLCAACADEYSMEGSKCSKCSMARTSSVVVLIIAGIMLIVFALGTLRLRFCSHHFQVLTATLRLLWPRINQSIALIITNYQILSGLPERVGIPFPEGVTNLLKSMTDLINVDVLQLPGLACVVGSSFYVKFLSNMLAPLIIVIAVLGLSKRSLRNLRTVTMPMPPDLDVDLDSIGEKGSPERRRHVMLQANFKICRAVVASQIQAPYYALICFIVFIRFPAATRIIFEMFKCHNMDGMATVNTTADDVSFLMVDYREPCYQGTHAIFRWIGLFFLCAYTISIPAYFLIKLTLYRTTIVGKPASRDFKPAVGKKGDKNYQPQVGTPVIRGNPDYIEIAPFKVRMNSERHLSHQKNACLMNVQLPLFDASLQPTLTTQRTATLTAAFSVLQARMFPLRDLFLGRESDLDRPLGGGGNLPRRLHGHNAVADQRLDDGLVPGGVRLLPA